MSKQNRKSVTNTVAAGAAPVITDSIPVAMPAAPETAEKVETQPVEAESAEAAETAVDNTDEPAANAVVATIMQARRADDPKGALVLVVSPENAGVLGEFVANAQHASASVSHDAPRRARPRRQARQPRREVRGRTTRAPRAAAAERSTGKTRGRVAGRYVMGTKEPAYLTDSIGGVYKYIQKHKKGATAKEVADALKMPMGTVGWALQVLKKTGAIDTQAA